MNGELAHRRAFLLLALVMAAAIVHGSLYPYAFRLPASAPGPIATLLQSWSRLPTSRGDLLVNLVLYMPLGFTAVLALHLRARVALVTLAGLMLCTGVELAQFYDAGRVTNLSDVYLNTVGMFAGAVAGARMEGRLRAARLRSVDPVPLLLLAAFLGYRLYPYAPTIDLHKYWHSVAPLRHPHLTASGVWHDFGVWLAAAYLVHALAPSRADRAVLRFMAGVFVAKILIVDLTLTAPEIAGAALALAFQALVFERLRNRALPVFLLLLAVVIAARLAPFALRPSPAPFGWMPFASFLRGSLAVDLISFFEKCFLYGSLVFIGSEAGLRLRGATLLVSAVLLAASVAERWLPGRSAETTDAAMALILGCVFAALTGRRSTVAAPLAYAHGASSSGGAGGT